ncbi:(2Fe-2S)-binding protein [Peribacillus psychrosaccharolyticus]|uniref:(2Fe-2S)-binding protein n=1 Tax=Peribacillus psychrosaccharolyticus TaxID=1407 RepID=A0A974S0W2_PERPY|nr:(2Fe-2S)-binding protein [Peribacillus psychrosaccharolyticus]MEC2057304.1 (2Fe-2S)-binding protein [Peribacillus psychrosaccharolyticus]MED3742869.1 (2Fe-2S)-binding protein [Peribacillus psychrosaccharolyticus]QQT01062.1 (2Fe-2S)-binding protein [Peribacillus psychrosaccharolyticus]
MNSYSANRLKITLNINSEMYEKEILASDTLLSVLRDKLGLTGAKPGCLNGDCGACTVIIDKRPMKSCMLLAVEAFDTEILTIEGLKDTPIQRAFVEQFAFQCGYCTPGFILICHALLLTDHHPTNEKITTWLSSNICRCTGYQEIENALRSVINSLPLE